MPIPKDWREFIELLNSNGVEYIIVGAVALAYHGFPRYTGDLDILIRSSPQNAERVESALKAFGFESVGLSAADLSEDYQVVQLGVAPTRIDLLTSITGVPFNEAWDDRAEAELEGVRVNFAGRRTLVQNKSSVGRPQDKADVEALEALDESK